MFGIFSKKNRDSVDSMNTDSANMASANNSAGVAKERLQIVLGGERSNQVVYLEALKDEMMDLVAKYTKSPRINITAQANRNNSLDIRVSISHM